MPWEIGSQPGLISAGTSHTPHGEESALPSPGQCARPPQPPLPLPAAAARDRPAQSPSGQSPPRRRLGRRSCRPPFPQRSREGGRLRRGTALFDRIPKTMDHHPFEITFQVVGKSMFPSREPGCTASLFPIEGRPSPHPLGKLLLRVRESHQLGIRDAVQRPDKLLGSRRPLTIDVMRRVPGLPGSASGMEVGAALMPPPSQMQVPAPRGNLPELDPQHSWKSCESAAGHSVSLFSGARPATRSSCV